jgi:hypothetical protein
MPTKVNKLYVVTHCKKCRQFRVVSSTFFECEIFYFYFLKAIAAVDVEDLQCMHDLKRQFCRRLCERFGELPREGTDENTVDGRTRKIVRCDIFQNKTLILASILDPRVKTAPFKGEFPRHAGVSSFFMDRNKKLTQAI